ncbi:8266_t:CDS:1, partial [Scutellospora calospora]
KHLFIVTFCLIFIALTFICSFAIAETPPPLPVTIPQMGNQAPVGMFTPEMTITQGGAFLPGGGAILAEPIPELGNLPVPDPVMEGAPAFINPNKLKKRFFRA